MIGGNGSSESVLLGSGDPDVFEIAKLAARQYNNLLVVMEGYGAFAQMHTIDELDELTSAILSFKNVKLNPVVVMVMVSPVQISHIAPLRLVGSLDSTLHTVRTTTQDRDVLMEWIRKVRHPISPSDLSALFKAAEGQLRPMKAAIFDDAETLDERLQTIEYIHRASGSAIRAGVGKCCAEWLDLGVGNEQCAHAMKVAGILISEHGMYRPAVRSWAESWGETWKES